jgi:hypothetical protein
VKALHPLTVQGTPLRYMDTRLNRAVESAERYLADLDIPTNYEPRPRTSVPSEQRKPLFAHSCTKES